MSNVYLDDDQLPKEVVVGLDAVTDLGQEPKSTVIELAGDDRPDDVPEEQDAGFMENLADKIDERQLGIIANRISELVASDIDSRSEWETRLDDGMQTVGLVQDPDDGPFPGASTVVHPMILEAMTQFQARALEELVPATGPVKGRVLGNATEPKRERRQRVEDYMNYQLMVEDKAYFWNTDQMLFMLPFAGSCFKKTYHDSVLDRNVSRFVKADNLIVPYTATSLEDAPRYTHRMLMSQNQLRKEMASGHYREIDISPPSQDVRTGDIRRVYDETEDREPTTEEDDSQHTIYECHIDYDLPGFTDASGIEVPYVITIDEDSRKVLAIYRNWKEDDDELKLKRVWFHHYKFLPGMGFYGYGFLHTIGSLNDAATGALRAMLDSAAFAALQGGFKAKDARAAAGEIYTEPGMWTDIDLTSDELNSAFYTPPWKEVPMALFHLLGQLQDLGRRYASTTEVSVGDASNEGPVGTTVALIEQGQKVTSGIHKRCHVAAGEEFNMLYELNAEYIPEDGYPYLMPGSEGQIFAEDFNPGEVDVIPVSDPNIISSTQRIAIHQGTLQLAEVFPQYFDGFKVARRLVDALRVPDPDDIMLDPEQIERMDPVTENMMVLIGREIRTFTDQDHAAHIAVHMSFMEHPEFGGIPAAQEIIQGAMVAHLAEHAAELYRVRQAQAGVEVLPANLHALPGQDILPPELQTMHEMVAAQAAQVTDQFRQMRGIEAPPEEDPAAAQMAEAQAKIQRDDAVAEAKIGRDEVLAQAKTQRDMQQFMADQERKNEEFRANVQRDQQEFIAEQQRATAESQADIQREDIEASRDIRRDDVESDAAIERADRESDAAIENAEEAAEANDDNGTDDTDD